MIQDEFKFYKPCKLLQLGKGDYVYSGVVQPAMNCFSCF